MCKKGELRLNFNRKILVLKYPAKVPINENDQFDLEYDITRTYQKFNNSNLTKSSASISSLSTNSSEKTRIKNIYKYTYTEEEYSVHNLPVRLKELHEKFVSLIEVIFNTSTFNSQSELHNSTIQNSIICLTLSETLPLTCEATHLHQFDQVELSNEPKIVYLSNTFYKLFYKEKSIEIACLINEPDNENKYCEYLISDSPTGRYYTSYTINARCYETDEYKLCIDNIPSFKEGLRSCINYANILLKRLNSITYVTKTLSCTTNKYYLDDSSNMNAKIVKQYVVNDVGHFKYFDNNTITIQFIDKVKLYVESNSINMYRDYEVDKCYCHLLLPDKSEHEINFMECGPTVASNSFYSKYLSFLRQWLQWIFEADNKAHQKENIEGTNEENKPINANAVMAHINNLKFFNFKLDQDVEKDETPTQQHADEDNIDLNTISSLLKQNSEFLKNISK